MRPCHRWWCVSVHAAGHSLMVMTSSAGCWFWTKVHYCFLLRHTGQTAEWPGQGDEGGVKRESGDVEDGEGREKRWGSWASQWERSEISIRLTAACVPSPPRLASRTHPHHLGDLSLISSERRLSEGNVVSLVKRVACVRMWSCSRPVFPVLAFGFLHANIFGSRKWFVTVKGYSMSLLRKNSKI